VSEGVWTLTEEAVDVDESLFERDAYREGLLTDEPSFSDFDEMLAEDGRDEDQDQETNDG
jgi:hypothetical protein